MGLVKEFDVAQPLCVHFRAVVAWLCAKEIVERFKTSATSGRQPNVGHD
jgi:hypothetical protein